MSTKQGQSQSEVVGAFARERGNILVLIPDKPPLVLNRLAYHSPEDEGLFGGLVDPTPGMKNPLTLRDQREIRDGR